MAGSAEQHSGLPKFKKESLMTKFIAVQRENTSSSHIGMINFHGWTTVVLQGKCSASHAESFLCIRSPPSNPAQFCSDY